MLHSKRKMLVCLVFAIILLSNVFCTASLARHRPSDNRHAESTGVQGVQIQLCELQHQGSVNPLLNQLLPTCPTDATLVTVSISYAMHSLHDRFINEQLDRYNVSLLEAVRKWALESLTQNGLKEYLIHRMEDNNEKITPHIYTRELGEDYGEGGTTLDAYTIALNCTLSILCICVAGLGAGLTMGMLSIEPLSLMIKMKCGSTQEVNQAKVLLPLILKRHHLLVTLLLLNSFATEALPIFLDKLVSSQAAVLISVTAVLIFGEILPTAVCTGPNQIAMAATMGPMVRVIMLLLSPIAWPIAKLLDRFLEHDDSISKAYAREEISALVRIMYEENTREKQDMLNSMLSTGSSYSSCSVTKPCTIAQLDNDTSMLEDMTEMTQRRSLDFDEVVMVEGALQLKTKTANDIFIPLSKVSAIEKDAILDEDTLALIYSSGHSRIPVYQRMHDSEGRVTDDISSITAILLTRQLMVVDSDDGRRVSTLPLFEPICVSNNISLSDLLHVFKQREHKKESKNYGRASHLAIVCINPDLANLSLDKGSPIPKEACVLGIVTLEDIIEQIVQENIENECRKEEVKAKTRARKVFQKWRGSTIKKKASSIVPFEIDAKKNQLLVYN